MYLLMCDQHSILINELIDEVWVISHTHTQLATKWSAEDSQDKKLHTKKSLARKVCAVEMPNHTLQSPNDYK